MGCMFNKQQTFAQHGNKGWKKRSTKGTHLFLTLFCFQFREGPWVSKVHSRLPQATKNTTGMGLKATQAASCCSTTYHLFLKSWIPGNLDSRKLWWGLPYKVQATPMNKHALADHPQNTMWSHRQASVASQYQM